MAINLFQAIKEAIHPPMKPQHQVYLIEISDPEGRRPVVHQLHWMPPNSRSSIIVAQSTDEYRLGTRKALILHAVKANPNVRTWDELDSILGLSQMIAGVG